MERLWEPQRARDHGVHALLRLASLPYAAVTAIRNALYDHGMLPSRRVPARVISVGNVTVGGTGKTPLALWLAAGLQARGRRVAIVTRGYGKTAPGVVCVGDGGRAVRSAAEGGDEAVMLARRFTGPVVAGADRVAAARYACETCDADTIVLDDGFQHRRLTRDVDVVLLAADPTRQRLLPAGPRRESWRGLSRAAAVVLADAALDDDLPHRLGATEALVCRLRTVPTMLVERPEGDGPATPLTWLQGRRVVAVAGIARPHRFVETLRALGATVVAEHVFPDHHPYDRDDVARLLERAGTDALVTTEKDLVKLAAFPALAGLRALRVDAVVDGGEALLDLATGLGCR
jgi:tetraacyldisaccharide 4'-kinase